MKISEFIKRLEELREVVGEDVEVAVSVENSGDCYKGLMVELQWVVPLLSSIMPGKWCSLLEDNTHQIIVVR